MPIHDVAALTDIPQGPSKAEAGDRAVLLIRDGDEVRAFTHECPHLKLPLSKGVVRDGVLICPFHHACFDARTGAQAEPPGHGDLARFEVTLRDGRVLVDVPDGAEPHPKPAAATVGADPRRIVLVGAGAVGHTAATTLRERGFQGTIEMIAPSRAPYDRTMLSKAVLGGGKDVADLTLDPEPELIGVVRIDDVATAVSPGRVTLASGGTRAFDACLVAPGGAPRGLDLPGEDMEGVHRLRDATQAEALAAALEGARRAVVIGGGFIGLEAAASLLKRGLEVTLATRDAVPLGRIAGERIARQMVAELAEQGLRHLPETEAARIEGANRVSSVVWTDGGATEADLVLVAVGVSPRTRDIAGLPHDEDGGVSVGADLAVPGLAGVHVGGDCARAPTPFGRFRIEHWRVAMQHGRRAALAMLGEDPGPDDIPFFWTALARQYRYLGHAEDWDDLALDGTPDAAFLARYVADGRVMAALTAGKDAELAELHLRMRAAGGPVPA